MPNSPLPYFFDTETNALDRYSTTMVRTSQPGHRGKYLWESSERGIIPQVTQFAGHLGYGDSRVGGGIHDLEIHMALDLPSSIDVGKDTPIEFRIDKNKVAGNSPFMSFVADRSPAGKFYSVNDDNISRILAEAKGEGASAQQKGLRDILTMGYGDFVINAEAPTNGSVSDKLRASKAADALKDLTVNYSTQKTPHSTIGMADMAAWQTGGVLNKVMALSVFKHRTGDTITRQEHLTKVLNSWTNLASDSSIGPAPSSADPREFVAWNPGFDLMREAEQVDLYGSDHHKKKFKDFTNTWQDIYPGTSGTPAEKVIRVVDAADTMKDLHFHQLLVDDSYSVHNIAQRAIQDDVNSGANPARIKKEVQAEIKQLHLNPRAKRTWTTENTALRSLADDVIWFSQRGGSQEDLQRKLSDKYIQKLENAGRTVTRGSVEEQMSKVTAGMVGRMSEITRSTSIGYTQELRRGIYEVKHLDEAENIFNIFFPKKGAGGIMGYRKDLKLALNADGEATKTVAQFLLDRVTALDTISGYTMSGGLDDRGVIGSFIQAKESYIETHKGTSSPTSNELKKIMGFIPDSMASFDELAGATGGAHTASGDTRRMGYAVKGIIENIMKTNVGGQTDVIEFMGVALTDAKLRGAESVVNKSVDATYIHRDIMYASGVSNSVPDQQTIASAGDTPARPTQSAGEAIHTAIEGRPKGIKFKQRGVLGAALLTLSGLALLGNNNGAMKHPGSKYNTLEGMSPSGDPLLHSFGSGVDHTRSQALTNLHYGFGYGSSTLRSSMLGYRGRRLQEMLLGTDSFDDYTKSSEKGNVVHGIIEAEYMRKGLAQAHEHLVYDSELDVMGHIDIVLKSGVPLEIKTVADFDALENLKYPKERHKSQANFYAYALKQPYALIGYAARNDPTKVKYFKINTDISKLMEDVSAVRNSMTDLKRQGHAVQNYSAYQLMKDTHAQAVQNKYRQDAVGPSMGLPEGMMQGPSSYGGYDGIRGLRDFGGKQRKVHRGAHPRHIQREKTGGGRKRMASATFNSPVPKRRQKSSGYHNRSRQLNYSGA